MDSDYGSTEHDSIIVYVGNFKPGFNMREDMGSLCIVSACNFPGAYLGHLYWHTPPFVLTTSVTKTFSYHMPN